jgi:hypothetical protein
VYSNLIAKARNLVVVFYLCSGGRVFAGKLIEVDEVFAEVLVKYNHATGEFLADPAKFENPGEGWAEDRVLINLLDISMIA